MKRFLLLTFLFASLKISAQVLISYGDQTLDSLTNSWKWMYISTTNYFPTTTHPTKITYLSNGIPYLKEIHKLNKDSLTETEIHYDKKNKFSRWKKTETVTITYENGKLATVIEEPITSKKVPTFDLFGHFKTMNRIFYPDSSTKIEIMYDSTQGAWLENFKIETKMISGRIISENNYSSRNLVIYSEKPDTARWKLESHITFFYNENNQLVKKENSNAVGKKYLTLYEYNTAEDVISTTHTLQEKPSDTPTLQSKDRYEYSSDRKTIYMYYEESTVSRRVLIFDKPPLHYTPLVMEIF
jgi:hypothetical protein